MTLFRFAHGALSITGWGWFWSLAVAGMASATIRTHGK